MIIKMLFEEAQNILDQECKNSKNEDFIRQHEIIRTRQIDRITDEPGILNNLAVQLSSYSVVRKYFEVLYPEEIYKFDCHYSTRFFECNSKPNYFYRDWVNITLSWGNALLGKKFATKQNNLDALVGELKSVNRATWSSYSKQPKSRLVLSLATALPKVKEKILSNPSAFFFEYDKISRHHPGKAFDLATSFSNEIIEVGEALVCNFFKELGLRYYVKVDVHVQSFMKDVTFCKKLSSKEVFILSWLIAKEAGMEPFFLDKIIYVGNKYANSKISQLLLRHREEYIDAIKSLVAKIPIYAGGGA